MKADYSWLDCLTLEELKVERNRARALAGQITKRINVKLADAGISSDTDYVSLVTFDAAFAAAFKHRYDTTDLITPERAQLLNGWFRKLQLTQRRLDALVLSLSNDGYFKMYPSRQRVLSKLTVYLEKSDKLTSIYYPGEEL